jgi:Ca2+:H+ antiporter
MRMPPWTLVVPIASLVLAGVALAWPPGTLLAFVCAAALIVSVLASVHHAEVVAHRVGEPFGTLILTIGLTFAVGTITLSAGRTNVLQDAVHLLIFAAFLFLAIVP